MTDPFRGIPEMQIAMLNAWTANTRTMFKCWGHMMELQHNFLTQAGKTRWHRWHVEIPSGPSFTEKYGRRSHDIDPERDV